MRASGCAWCVAVAMVDITLVEPTVHAVGGCYALHSTFSICFLMPSPSSACGDNLLLEVP